MCCLCYYLTHVSIPTYGVINSSCRPITSHFSVQVKQSHLMHPAMGMDPCSVIVCRKTDQHANADAMGRLPLPYTPDETSLPAELGLMVEGLQDVPITATQIAQWMRHDPLMARVIRYILEGWPNHCDEDLRPYWTRNSSC